MISNHLSAKVAISVHFYNIYHLFRKFGPTIVGKIQNFPESWTSSTVIDELPPGRNRIELMCRTENGFEIAEEDFLPCPPVPGKNSAATLSNISRYSHSCSSTFDYHEPPSL